MSQSGEISYILVGTLHVCRESVAGKHTRKNDNFAVGFGNIIKFTVFKFIGLEVDEFGLIGTAGGQQFVETPLIFFGGRRQQHFPLHLKFVTGGNNAAVGCKVAQMHISLHYRMLFVMCIFIHQAGFIIVADPVTAAEFYVFKTGLQKLEEYSADLPAA